MPEAIQIHGLAEFRKALLRLDKEWSATAGLKRVGDEAAGLVVGWARPRVPFRTGRAQRSVRATSSATAAQVTGGGVRVPWYPFVDFGGRVGRKRVVRRAFVPEGRYIYPGYAAVRPEVEARLAEGLLRTIRSVGWDVTDSG